MSLFAELKRRNVFKVGAAYVIVGWLLMQVGEVMAPALHLPDWILSALAFFLILGLPLALFFAWAFEMTPEGLKKEKDVDRSESITQVTGQKLNNMIIGLLVLALGYFVFDKFIVDPRRDAELAAAIEQAQKASAKQSRKPIAMESAPLKFGTTFPAAQLGSASSPNVFEATGALSRCTGFWTSCSTKTRAGFAQRTRHRT